MDGVTGALDRLVELGGRIPAAFVNLVFVAGMVMVGGTLVFETWRKSPLLPLAALVFGVIFGYFAVLEDGGGWIVFWTIFGAFAGPNVAVILSGEGVAKAFAKVVLDRLGVEAGSADDGQEPPTDTA